MNGWAELLISKEVADKVGHCWGLGSGTAMDPGPWEGELRNMWKPTAQEGLWFHGGNLVQSRFHSLHLALQLKARMEGIATPVAATARARARRENRYMTDVAIPVSAAAAGRGPRETVNRPDSPYAWYVLFVLIVVYTFNAMDRTILSILAEDIKRTFGMTDTQLGVLHGTAFGVFYALFGYPMGRLID
eukprot:gene3111-3667_t